MPSIDIKFTNKRKKNRSETLENCVFVFSSQQKVLLLAKKTEYLPVKENKKKTKITNP